VRYYTLIAQGGEPMLIGAGRQLALEKLTIQLERLELTYNFLAFVAPPLGGNLHMHVDSIVEIIEDPASNRWLDMLRATLYNP
jgi:hypothetical protein